MVAYAGTKHSHVKVLVGYYLTHIQILWLLEVLVDFLVGDYISRTIYLSQNRSWIQTFMIKPTTWALRGLLNIGSRIQQSSVRHPPTDTREDISGGHIIYWSSYVSEYTVNRELRPFLKGGISYWTRLWMKVNHSIGQICWLSRCGSMYLMPLVLPRVGKIYVIFFHIYWIQFTHAMHSLAWIGFGHHRSLPCMFIARCFRSENTEE